MIPLELFIEVFVCSFCRLGWHVFSDSRVSINNSLFPDCRNRVTYMTEVLLLEFNVDGFTCRNYG